MTILTEGRHAAEFLVSEANGTRSRSTGTVAMGQNLVAGEIVMFDEAGKLVVHDGAVDSAGVTTAVAGIMWDNVDASATGENADVPGAVYIDADAEVNDGELTYPDDADEGEAKQAVVDSLATIGIKVRT